MHEQDGVSTASPIFEDDEAPTNPTVNLTDVSVSAARKPRGFAAMDRKLVCEIARKGGVAAHVKGTAHEFTTEEAKLAGQKGGRVTHARRMAKKAGLG